MASPSSSSTSPSPVQEEQEEDRLGALPDPILLHILSFLPTLDAVRTSALSRRWRILWTTVGALDLDEAYHDCFFDTGERPIGGSAKRKRKSKISFVEFVGKVLSFHHTPTLHKLRLSCCSRNCPVEDWVRTAVSREVKTLHVRLPPHPDPDGNAGPLPSLLFASQSLVDLQLDLAGSVLVLPVNIALVGLRRMRLCRVKFCDDHLTRALFSSSTALRSLALEDCNYEKLGCLEISCCSLRVLAIEDSSLETDGLDSCQVKIAARQLSSFVYRASVAEAYIVEPLLCVKYVKIQFRRFEPRQWFDKFLILHRASSFLSVLSSARNLDICPVCIEVSQIASPCYLLIRKKILSFRWFNYQISERYPFSRINQALRCVGNNTSLYGIHFRNLNVVRIAVKHLDYEALNVILNVLLLNRHLRALIIEVRDLSVLPSTAGKEGFLKLLGACFKRRNRVVERVEIRCTDHTSSESTEVIRYTTETILELVKVLLGSQARLKKLILSNRLFCDSSSPDRRRDAVMEKVMSFPKSSSELLAVAFI